MTSLGRGNDAGANAVPGDSPSRSHPIGCWERGNVGAGVPGERLGTFGNAGTISVAGEERARRRPTPRNAPPPGNAPIEVNGSPSSCAGIESPTIHGTASTSRALPTEDTHDTPETLNALDLDEALTKQGCAPLLPIHERRDRDRWLARLRAGVERVKPEASARRRAAIDHARERGHATGSPEFGYRRTAGGALLVEDAREQRILDLAAEMRADGHTLQSIADTLNATPGLATRRGTDWTVTTVRRRLVRIGCFQKGAAA